MNEEQVVGLHLTYAKQHRQIMGHLPKAVKDWVAAEQKDIEEISELEWDNHILTTGQQDVRLKFTDGSTLQKTFGPFDLIEH